MRKSILNPSDYHALMERLSKINGDTKPAWGVMNAPQMLRHIFEGNKIVTGELNLGDKSTFMTRTLMRYFVLKSMVPPAKTREKNPPMTFGEVDVVKSGIKVDDFETEKKRLIANLEHLLKDSTALAQRHPLFGKMNRTQWGQFIHSHLNYHFTQFGV